MYLVHMKTLAVKAMRATFDADYADPDFDKIPVEMEYPVKSTQFPSVWVDFQPIGPLSPVGIGHFEDAPVYQQPQTDPPIVVGFQRTARWNFAGNISYTAIAMTSMECARLYDQLISIIAFGLTAFGPSDLTSAYDDQRGAFRRLIEQDPLIQLAMNFAEIDQRGFSAAPGTPWGTDDMMYEATIAVQVVGEFVSTPGEELLVPIERYELITWIKGMEHDPTTEDGWIGG